MKREFEDINKRYDPDLLNSLLEDEKFVNKMNGTAYRIYEYSYKDLTFYITMN